MKTDELCPDSSSINIKNMLLTLMIMVKDVGKKACMFCV